jgi:hypothetical protein
VRWPEFGRPELVEPGSSLHASYGDPSMFYDISEDAGRFFKWRGVEGAVGYRIHTLRNVPGDPLEEQWTLHDVTPERCWNDSSLWCAYLWVLGTRTSARSLRSVLGRSRSSAVLNLLRSLLLAGLAFVRTRRQLAVEILALRHQLGVLQRSVKRPRLSDVDRGLWVLRSRRWAGCGARDRDPASRAAGSRHRVEPGSSATTASEVRQRVLSSLPDPSFARKGCARAACGGAAGDGARRRAPAGWWVAPSTRATRGLNLCCYGGADCRSSASGARDPRVRVAACARSAAQPASSPTSPWPDLGPTSGATTFVGWTGGQWQAAVASRRVGEVVIRSRGLRPRLIPARHDAEVALRAEPGEIDEDAW